MLLGPDADPAERNVVGLIKKNPDLAKMAIKTRKIGQEITSVVGGKPIHPVTSIPGGQSKALSVEERDELLPKVKEGIGLVESGLEVAKPLI